MRKRVSNYNSSSSCSSKEIRSNKNKWNIEKWKRSFFFFSFVLSFDGNSGNKPKISLLRKGNGVGETRKGRKGDRNFPHRCIKIQHSVQTWRDSSELGRQWNMKLYRIQQLSECYLSWTANMNLFNIMHHSRTITVIIHRSLFPIFGYQLIFWNTTNV